MAGTRTKRSVATAIALLSVLAGVGYCAEESQRTAREKAQSDREAKAARSLAASVSVLPPGTEEAWLEYVDRRIAATMKREGSTVEISPLGSIEVGSEFGSYREYISINMPYKITCLDGALIDFGVGNDPLEVLIYPWLGVPALGVDKTSIAAKKLHEALCRKVSDRVQAIMSPR